MKIQRKTLRYLVLLFIIFSLFAGISFAHCDAKNGPVAVAARKALQNRNFETIQIWVGKEQENELQKKFQQSLSVYRQGGKAGQLAEDYFVDTAVRLHRAAEGMPFTGVKPAKPLPQDIYSAEKALEEDDVKIVTDFLKKEVENRTEKWFKKAMQAKKQKDGSVTSGREWVDAYVKYVIYVHGLYQKIQAGPAHGVGEQ